MNHIHNYNKYNKNIINEKINWDRVTNLVLALSMAWASYNWYNNKFGNNTILPSEVKQYAINNNILDNTIVSNAINIVKDMVKNNSNITNKEDVLIAIDSVLIIFNKDDEISNAIVNTTNDNHGSTKQHGVTIWFKTTKYPVILLSTINENTIIHELNHVVDYFSDLDISGLPSLFDFTIDDDEQKRRTVKIFNRKPDMNNMLYRNLESLVASEKMKIYLQKPSELNVRLKNLKLFLYRHNYLKSPTDKLTKKIITDLFDGKVYENLTPLEKTNFINYDFIQILPFLKIYKYKEIDKYANNILHNEKEDMI